MQKLRTKLFYTLIALEIILIGLAVFNCVTDLQALGIVTSSGKESATRALYGFILLLVYWLGITNKEEL